MRTCIICLTYEQKLHPLQYFETYAVDIASQILILILGKNICTTRQLYPLNDAEFSPNIRNINSVCTISINRFCKNARVAAVSIFTIFGQSKSLPVDS